MDNIQKRIELKHLLKNLPFTKENFELLKEELIDSIYPKSISEQVEDAMSGIDRNFQEDMINDMDMGQDY
tara:strand:+ start:460 stop:669 length:210 start_codon:yes stop_codon:yes gene_type:complete